MEICGVEFTEREQYEAVKYAVESLAIEGMKPTFEGVKGIKDLLEGKMTVEDIKKKYVETSKIQ